MLRQRRLCWSRAKVLVFALLLEGFVALPAMAGSREEAQQQKDAGDTLLKNGDQKGAEAAYKKAFGLDPSWYVPMESLGNLLFSSGRYMEAIEVFKKAVEAEPRYLTGFYNIAFSYRKAGKYADAAEFYQKYIAQQAQDPDAYYGLAASFEAMGKKKEAMDNYLLYAQKENRPSERSYVVKAKEKAEELKKSLGLAPTPAETAVASNQPVPSSAKPPESGTTSSAAASPSTATASQPPASSMASTSGSPAGKTPDKTLGALLQEGDKAMKEKSYTRAMKAYFEAVKADPKNVEALYKLGLVYQLTGNSQAAVLKWKNVIVLEPNHAGAKEALAKLEAAAPSGNASKPAEIKPQETKQSGTNLKPSPQAGQTDQEPALAPVAKTPATAPSGTTVASSTKDGSVADRVSTYMKEGDSQFKQKSFSRAIASYSHATQLDPKNEEALFKLAVAYAMSGNYKVAVFKWQQVLAINPNNESARRNIERAQEKLKGPGGAAPSQPGSSKAADGKKEPVAPAATTPTTATTSSTAGKAAPTAPQMPAESFESLVSQANEFKKRGDAGKVLEFADRALSIKQDGKAMLLRGEALVILNRYSDAKYAFAKVMTLDPASAAPIYGLGEACRLSGDTERAKYYFKMYIRSKASDVVPSLVKKAEAFVAGK